MNKEYDLFISYADADRPWVEGYFLDALNQVGVRHLSETGFPLGAPRIQEFQRAVQQSQRTLLVLSPAYLANSFNQFVDLLGQTYGEETQTWPVIPLILQPVRLPPRLAMLVPLRAVTDEEQKTAITRLCDDIKRKPIVLNPSLKPLCPYPGMKPFTEAESHHFFGREQEIEVLLGRLRLHPFLMVIGPSGSGKSSLVFAGLLPKLRQTGLLGAGKWLIRSMRPGATPLTTLKEILGNEPISARNISQILSTESNAQRFLLVIDQFEEVFTQESQEKESQETVPFQQALLELTEIPNVYLVLTVSADFYSDLMTSVLWRKIEAYRLEVLPLNEKGLRRAILQPAENSDVFIESALLERLVNDADAKGAPGFLPLIQETLVLLWDRLERQLLPLRAYEALIKDYGGHCTGIQVAIALHADQALATLEVEPDKQRAIARRIFLRLVQFGEGRPDTRRQQTMNQLQAVGDDPNLFKQTLYHLANRRLLTLSSEETSTAIKVDIAHEALISGWPTLQQWILERRASEQIRRRLTAKAEEWIRLGEGAGGLLDKIELDEAKQWLSSPDAHDLGDDASLPRLITASQLMIRRTEAKQLLRFGFVMASTIIVLGLLFSVVLPSSATFLNNRGMEKFFNSKSKAQDESALKDLDIALMLNPKFAAALYNRGFIYEKKLNFDRALANYQGAVELGYVPAYGQLARLEIIREQNYSKAVYLAREGLKLATDDDDEAKYTLNKNLGWAQRMLKEYPEAKANLQTAIKLDPKRGSAYCLLAKVLEDEKLDHAAREQWNNCLKFGNPDNPDEGVWMKEAKSKLSKEGS